MTYDLGSSAYDVYVKMRGSGICLFHYQSTGRALRLIALILSCVIMKIHPPSGKCYAAKIAA